MQLFTQTGLNDNEAITYNHLLQHGESDVNSIINNTPLKKGVIYNALEGLITIGLVQKKMLRPKNPKVRNKQKIAYFSAQHPEKLLALIEQKEKTITEAKNSLLGNLENLSSQYNLSSGKPGIRFYEGEKGIKAVLADSLTAQETIRTFVDVDALVANIPELNAEYAKQRNALGIKKKAIARDTPSARSYLSDYHSETTEIRFINGKNFPFQAISELYDNKLAYITFSQTAKIGVMIHDPEIYKMNLAIFEHAWKHAKPFRKLHQIEKI